MVSVRVCTHCRNTLVGSTSGEASSCQEVFLVGGMEKYCPPVSSQGKVPFTCQHVGTRTRKFQRKSFDVACVQCGHSHSAEQVPFACVAHARPVWIRPRFKRDLRRLVTWCRLTHQRLFLFLFNMTSFQNRTLLIGCRGRQLEGDRQ